MKQQVIELKQQGLSIRQIAEALNISKGSVQNHLKDYQAQCNELTTVNTIEAVEQRIEAVKQSKPDQVKAQTNEQPTPGITETNEKRFSSFIGWHRIDVNTYVNNDSGEVAKVAFVKAKDSSKCGYFVRIE